MEQSYQYIFKIILIGECGVGKTSLMNRYIDNAYEQWHASTIGLDFKIKTINIGENRVKLQIWDTAGQERFRAMISGYYRGANGIFIVFDMLNRSSFLYLKDWIEELSKKDVLKSAEIRILGNKVDDQSNICVSREEINQFLNANRIPLCNFYEVSAKNDIHVEESFIELTKRLIEKCGSPNVKQSTKTTLKMESKRNKRGCC